MKTSLAVRLGFERAGRSRDIRLDHAFGNYGTASNDELSENRLPSILEWLDRSFDNSLSDDDRSHARQMVIAKCCGEKIPRVREYLSNKNAEEMEARQKRATRQQERFAEAKRQQPPAKNLVFKPNSPVGRKHKITDEFKATVRRMYAIERRTVSDIAKETGQSRYYVEVALKEGW